MSFHQLGMGSTWQQCCSAPFSSVVHSAVIKLPMILLEDIQKEHKYGSGKGRLCYFQCQLGLVITIQTRPKLQKFVILYTFGTQTEGGVRDREEAKKSRYKQQGKRSLKRPLPSYGRPNLQLSNVTSARGIQYDNDTYTRAHTPVQTNHYNHCKHFHFC